MLRAQADSRALTDLDRFRPWLYGAAVYNVVWGTVTVLFPDLFFRVVGLPLPNYPSLWQVTGMFVQVYGLGYWWAARRPERHAHVVLLGLIGKILGPIGFVGSVATGSLPLAFGWTLLTNDLVWWPSFLLYLAAAARRAGGWAPFLLGED
jgi:hypothetical protein